MLATIFASLATAPSVPWTRRLLLPFRAPSPHTERVLELAEPRCLGSFLGNSGTVAPLPGGQFCVSDTSGGRVLLLGADGAVLATSPLLFEAPAVLALSRGRDAVYVADAGDHAVHRLALPSLQLIGSITGGGGGSLGLSYPSGLAVSAATGRVYISDKGNHRVICFEEALDDVVFEFGVPGRAGSVDGMLNLPSGVCILEPERRATRGASSRAAPHRAAPGVEEEEEEEVIVVADTGNHRLILFGATSGIFLRALGGAAAAPPPGMSAAEFAEWSSSSSGAFLTL